LHATRPQSADRNGSRTTLRFVVELPCSAEMAFAWHARRGALERLTPPWQKLKVLRAADGVQPGTRVELRVKLGPVWRRWVAEHRDYVAGLQFRDVQVSGPFALFEHTHRITPEGAASCRLEDTLQYAPPGGWLGRVLAGRFIERELSRAFAYRHRITAADLAQAAISERATAMKVLVTGATGLIGRQLAPLLTTQGHEVFRLVRREPTEANDVPWDPDAGVLHPARLEGLNAVVHLAGESVGARWTKERKERIRSSRVEGTRLLCRALADLKQKPQTLVCASAIGYYGDRGNEQLAEESSRGEGFLPDVCAAWEQACDPARRAGIRVVNLRIGVVLSPQGGALKQMLLPFELGLGGVIGSGRQYVSWIAIDDVVGAINHCLTHAELTGPVNATAPNPASNHEFTKTLGGVLRRPTVLPMPAFAVRLAFGEMGQELLLSSTRVSPQRLQQSGYSFRYPTLEGALRHVLGR
jgi:uncharacterized protein (TIGR01777 family)